MPVKVVKPTTEARRGMSYPDFSVLTKKAPEKSLLVSLKKHAGRNNSGKLTVRHRGGGAKRAYRVISSLDKYLDKPATVAAIEYDPNRSAWIALVSFESGEKAYIVAPDKLAVGAVIIGSETADIIVGNRMKLANIPTGIQIHDIEMTPGSRARAVRSAGTSATILAKEDDGVYVQVRMPSGEVRRIHSAGYGSIGEVSNSSHSAIRIAKAGRKRHMGIRPTVRGKVMHPAAHPHGGGEGNNPIGLRYPKTPWGKPALGKKTRRNKRTDKFILRRRGSKR